MRSSGSKKTLSDRVQLLLRDFNKWSALSIATALLMALPILLVALGLFDGVGEMWQHLVQYLLLDYLSNSAILLLGTGILCTFVGVACAWCVCQYDFPLRSLLSQLLLLPLAIPSYVVAYAYVGTFGNSGSLQTLLASFGIGYQKLHLMNSYGLIWVLSMSLFPYVYISTRAAFWSQSIRLEEAAYLLGASSRRYWRTIVLPLAQPAIVGGLFLVFMEVLNDYGAAKYYGIRTFTTGIFRTWTALEDLQTAIYLSAILVLLVLSLRWLERWQRGRRSYAAKGNSIQRPRQQLSKPNAYLMSFAVALPFFFGFLLPVGQLTYWAILTFNTVFNIELFWIAAQACGIALLAASFAVIVALCLIYFVRWNPLRGIEGITKIATIGYVIPGAIIGIGVMSSSQSIIHFFETYFGLQIGYLFYASSIILIYAYVVRFLAVAYNPIQAQSLKTGRYLPEASYLLGKSSMATLWKIEFPLLRNSLIGAFMLVFIDTLKELPLTLILKPYHLQTLATKAYEYADDERVAEAALPALLLIFLVVSVMFLVRKLDK